ncbi:MAG TPA: DUF2934 domain-containing protein [Afifellaceae bacterium]|nr:DUF2934 domain-containing protein [Afifellaceae bacterium]
MSDRDERIKQRAYEIWESEGRPEGRHLDHWRRAASEIDNAGQGAGAAPSAQPPSGISSSLQPSGTAPGGGPGASQGSVGTGGGSAGSSGNVERSPRSGSSS